MTHLILTLLLLLQTQPIILPAEREIASSPVEIGVCLSRQGVERWRFVGTANGQTTMPEWMPRHCRGQIFTHNHVSEDHCVNLSVDDVQFGAWYGLYQIRAVAIEKGIVYAAVITKPHWLTYDDWNKAFDRHKDLEWCAREAATWHDLGYNFSRIS